MRFDTSVNGGGHVNSATSNHSTTDDLIRRIRTIVRQKRLLPGEKVGTERALAQSLQVNRSTLRNALSRLEETHEIVRLIGRGGGIVVSDNKLVRLIDTPDSLRDMARRQGHRIESKVLSASLSAPSEADRRHLLLPDGTSIYRISRLRDMDGSPFSLEQSIVPADLFAQLLTKDVAPSLYSVLTRIYCVAIKTVQETFEVAEATFETANLLNQPEGTPLVRVLRSATDTHNRIVEHSVDLYVASKVRFTLHSNEFVRLSMLRDKPRVDSHQPASETR
ncbi:GntR family transcriptional regulator [Bifidobacterium sp.]|uniref:GntR family transcriptional regulator n=1 Tax=Bifidobacterium sp. TaxID=41200 RepID=UPI0039ED84C9